MCCGVQEGWCGKKEKEGRREGGRESSTCEKSKAGLTPVRVDVVL